MRPFFPFYGSKWNIARYYPRPRHNEVVEPFAGGAGYSLFYDVPVVTLVDADPIIAGVWAYLLKVKPAEVMSLPELPNVGDSVDDYLLPQEAKWLIGFWLNRGSAMPKKTRTAYSARTDKAQLNWSRRAKERIAAQLPLIRRWKVRCGNYDSGPNRGATWFVDPPYGDKGKFYRVKFDSFAALGDWSRTRMGQVIVCEGPGATWLPFRSLGSFKSSKGRADEMVWTNDDATSGGLGPRIEVKEMSSDD